MNKRLLFSVLGASALVGFTACQNDDLMSNGADGTQTVTFSAQLPNALTRAYGDAGSIKTLHYAVYPTNSSTAVVNSYIVSPEATNSFSVQVDLVKGQKYDIFFWADCGEDDSPYEFTGKSVNVSYEENLASNNEKRDAFYAVKKEFTATSGTAEVELYRPFAQLNIATTDYAVAQAANITVSDVQVTTKVYPTFDLVNGVGSGAEVEKTFAAAPILEEDFPIESTDGKTYTYLAMNYLLSGDTETVGLVISTKGGSDIPVSISNVPFKANYRTNIVGSFLTNSQDFDVIIKPGFSEPDKNISVWDGSSLEMPNIDTESNTATIDNAAQLAGFAALVNGTWSGDNVTRTNVDYTSMDFTLTDNIDLGGKEWTPIGNSYNEVFYSGSFDGNGKTISNLKITKGQFDNTVIENKDVALFGAIKNASIKNLTIQNVDVSGCLQVGALVGYAYAGDIEIDNITVKGSVKINAACYTGTVIARNYFNTDVKVSNVTIDVTEDSFIRAYHEKNWGSNVGGVVGHSDANIELSNVHSDIAVEGNASYVGGIIGLLNAGNVIENSSSSGNVKAIYHPLAKQYTIGGIAGAWLANATSPVTVSNCVYTGTLSFDGTPEGFDNTAFVNFGLVGAPHKYYTSGELNLDYVLSTPQQLQLLPTYVNNIQNPNSFQGKTIKLGADIDLDGIDWMPIGIFYPTNNGVGACYFSGTFDGKGHEIKNLMVKNKFCHLAESANYGKDYYGKGFFGTTHSMTVKNVTFKNAKIGKGDYSDVAAGVVAGYIRGITVFDNVKVLESKVSGFGKLGAIAGYNDHNTSIKSTFTNCVVDEKTVVEGAYNLAGLIGVANNDIEVLYDNTNSINTTFILNDNFRGFGYKEANNGVYWMYNTADKYAAKAIYYNDFVKTEFNVQDEEGNVVKNYWVGNCHNEIK
jgi:hypothetical protein